MNICVCRAGVPVSTTTGQTGAVATEVSPWLSSDVSSSTSTRHHSGSGSGLSYSSIVSNTSPGVCNETVSTPKVGKVLPVVNKANTSPDMKRHSPTPCSFGAIGQMPPRLVSKTNEDFRVSPTSFLGPPGNIFTGERFSRFSFGVCNFKFIIM